MRLVVDIEADGLYQTVSKVHCIVLKDIDTDQMWTYTHFSNNNTSWDWPSIKKMFEEASLIIGHNILNYDIPVLNKIYGLDIDLDKCIDTYVLSQIFCGNYKGGHSLAAWGQRLGFPKMDYDKGFEELTPEMVLYCEQDVNVTEKVFYYFQQTYPLNCESVKLEHRISPVLTRQEHYGFLFDTAKARILKNALAAKLEELEKQLEKFFPTKVMPKEVIIPERSITYKNPQMASKTAGAAFQTIEVDKFNPGSRLQILKRLQEKYDWEPTLLTDKGNAKLSIDILETLPYEETAFLADYMLIQKRYSQLVSGSNAWFKMISSTDNRIHGSIMQNGTVTGRMTHFKPNMAQVPAIRTPYGKECRELFTVPKGRVLVGVDASALEMRCLAGYLYPYDKGAYMQTILKGSSSDGTDAHSINAEILGCDREVAKTWFYAFLYGAGDIKLGFILNGREDTKKLQKLGRESRSKFLTSLTAINQLITSIKDRLEENKYLKGLDRRRLVIRSEHSALNFLLQSAGALIMKQALIFCDRKFQSLRQSGATCEFVANVHDEWQIECSPEIAEEAGTAACKAIEEAGEYFKFPCPMAGEYKIGRNWSETH